MIRILIVDDQNIVRQGLQALLEPRSKLKVVGTAENGESAIEQIKTLRPDIALIDLEMPGINGITVTQKICQTFPETKIIILSSHENQKYVRQALQAGAEGYLLKSTLAENLEQAILSVHQGHLRIESKLLKKIIVEVPFSNFTTLSQQNGSLSVAKQLSNQEVDADSKEELISDDLTRLSDSDNIYLPKATGNIPGIRNESLPKISKASLKPVFEPTKLEAEKLQLKKPRSKEISLINFRSRVNSKLAIVPVLLIMTIT